MLDRPIDSLTISDIQELVVSGTPEGRRIEFKRDHYGRTDEQRKEFSADVSAFANSSGGDLVIGVAEKSGVASDVCGVEQADVDGLIRAVTESLQNAFEPQIYGIRVKWVPTDDRRGVLVIRVPRSWRAPHRVIVARDSRFYIRDENGKHPMSVDELRHAFLNAEGINKRIQQFRLDRLELIDAHEGPLLLTEEQPKLILHYMPLSAFADRQIIDIGKSKAGVPPLGASGYNSMHSIDGLVTYSGPEWESQVRAFTTLFRDGVIEAVAAIYTGQSEGIVQIDLGGVEEYLLTGTRSALAELDRLEISHPVFIAASLLGVRGLCVPSHRWSAAGFPQRRNRILLPEIQLERSDDGAWNLAGLKPMCDLLWNAFGRAGSPNFNEEGKWVRR